MLQLDEAQGTRIYAAEAIKKMCLEAGADDVGLADMDRESLQKEREGMLYNYPLTRSIISVIVVNNHENIQSPARYVANEEFHHAGDKISSVAREIFRRLNRSGIRGVVVNKGWLPPEGKKTVYEHLFRSHDWSPTLDTSCVTSPQFAKML